MHRASVSDEFRRLLELEPQQRADQLARLGQEDPSLAEELSSLLAEADAADLEGFLELPTLDGEDSDSFMPLPPGTRIGSYELVELLGHGGMGMVYLAVCQEVGRKVALKLVNARLGPTRLRRFHAERELLAQLDHPNIVRLHSSGTSEDNQPYLAMEYVPGIHLDAFCDRPEIDLRKKVQIIRQIAWAIQYAHDQGVLHRDLKPSNVLVLPDGTPKVTDFGLARSLRRDTVGTLSTQGTILGSPGYIAPEQIEASAGRNLPGVDVYSLGAILYRVLTGKKPHEGSSPVQMYMTAVSQDPEAPCRLRPDLPRDLETITLAALARDPAERLPTAEKLAEQLDLYLAGQPLTISRANFWNRAAKWGFRHRRPLGGSLLALGFVLATSLIVLGVSKARSDRAIELMAKEFLNIAMAGEWMKEVAPAGQDNVHRYHKRTVEAYELLLRETPVALHNPKIRFATALANYHLAASFSYRPSAEERRQARPHFDRAIELFRQLVDEDPGNATYRQDLCRAYKGRGYSPINPGQSGEADLRLALREAEELVRRFPEEPAWRDVLAHSYFSLALPLSAIKTQEREAETHLMRAAEIAAKLQSDYPDEPLYAANEYRALSALGGLYSRQNRWEEAEASMRRAVDLSARMLRAEPKNIHRPLEYTSALSYLCSVLLNKENPAEAETTARMAIPLVERMIVEFPDDGERRISHAFTYWMLGLSLNALDRPEEAETALRQAIDSLEQHLSLHPSSIQVLGKLIEFYENTPLPGLRNPQRAADLRRLVEEQGP